MESWEMIKKLTESPDKKFQIELRDHLIAYVDKETDRIVFENTVVTARGKGMGEFLLELGDKWEEIK